MSDNQSIKAKTFFIETYGCQMNVADSEVVVSILAQKGYQLAEDFRSADVILLNTCSIRENAEQRIWGRLDLFRSLKRTHPQLKIGLLGCMAERLKDKLLDEKKVDLVAGPDSYRMLPELIDFAVSGQKAINTILSIEETYADINPVRYDTNGVTAFISIMRGCNYACAYCVVPFVRGKERSRDVSTIIAETEKLLHDGFKEVTLIGQNADKYLWNNSGNEVNFAKLLERVARIDSHLRVRFSTSYPSDITEEVMNVMAANQNICRSIHLPVQSGSSRMLELMRRRYSREKYLETIEMIRKKVPDVSLSTDIISGFCTETDDDHLATLSLMEKVKYDFAYMFKYSERPNTYASRKYQDDVPDEIKSKRLSEIIDLQNKHSLESKRSDIGKVFEVLIEGNSKKSHHDLFGRTSQNKVVVFTGSGQKAGEFADVEITDCTSATLIGKLI